MFLSWYQSSRFILDSNPYQNLRLLCIRLFFDNLLHFLVHWYDYDYVSCTSYDILRSHMKDWRSFFYYCSYSVSRMTSSYYIWRIDDRVVYYCSYSVSRMTSSYFIWRIDDHFFSLLMLHCSDLLLIWFELSFLVFSLRSVFLLLIWFELSFLVLSLRSVFSVLIC